MKKVMFELENLFPLVNKITFGRLTTFCPVFHTDSILKDLSSCFVTASEIGKSIEQIRSIDYSAYYREAMDMNNLNSVGKEYFHFEYLPDIILMPKISPSATHISASIIKDLELCFSKILIMESNCNK